ncbi:MAG: hypothetical protein JSU73_12155 [candidate division WOR-3 bacterium]|nr:MAG: hypothetical protein JSU73_12155 [candidate division WOR-3 bacterium]
MNRLRLLPAFFVLAGLLGCFVLSAGCTEPQHAEEDEFPPPNDPPPA